MSQPVTLSDDLILDARLPAEADERSIDAQIEFWAQLGRAVDSLLRGTKPLPRRGSATVRPLSKQLESIDTEDGRQRVTAYLQARPFPHYEPAPGRPGYLIRIEADGSRSCGRFVNREFQVSE